MSERRLILEVSANQPEANWLWEALKSQKEVNGLKLIGIMDGKLEHFAEGEVIVDDEKLWIDDNRVEEFFVNYDTQNITLMLHSTGEKSMERLNGYR